MFSILFGLISRTPLRVLRGMSLILTKFLILFKAKQYQVTQKNINHCFGQNSELINNSFRETIDMSLVFPFIWGRKDNFKKLLDRDYIQNKTLDNGRPKLFFTLHMGCVDMLVFIMGELLSQINILYTPAKNKKLEAKLKKIRESGGAKMLPATDNGVKDLYKRFLAGENLLIASDLVPHKKGVYEKFFNKECFCIDLIEKLSQKNTHDLYVVYLTKGKEKKYSFKVKKIENQITTKEMNRHFEEAILGAPEIYGWEYKKFRKLRPNNTNIY